MWPLKTIAYFALFWIACFMALVNPIWGVVNYLVAYQTNPTDTWWGLPLTEIGMRFSMFAAVFTLLGLLFSRKKVPKVSPVFSLWELGLFALLLIALVNFAISDINNDASRYAMEKLWKMWLFTFVLGRLASTRANLKLVIWSLVVGSFYIGYDAYTAPASSFWLGRLERIGGPDFSTTSGTAAHLSAMLPLIGAAFLTARHWKWRILAAITGAFTVNAIVLCRTRSAFIGLACGVLAAFLTTPRVKRFRIHVLLVTGIIVAFSLTDGYFWRRMSTLTSKNALAQDAAAVSRTEIWALSLKILRDNPAGIGPGNFPRVIGSYDARYYKRSTHNTLLVCFTELGVVGGVIFLLMALSSLRLLQLSNRLAADTEDPMETKLLVYGALISFITYFVTGLGTERFYCESFWWISILPLCLHRMVTREATATVPVPRPASIEEKEEPHPLVEPTGGLKPAVT